MSAALEHLERRLGAMKGGWSVDEVPHGHKITVCMFGDGELSNVTSYATVGLSGIPLQVREGKREISIELMACSYSAPNPRESGYGPWPGILEYVASSSVQSGTAVLRGDFIRLPGPIAPGSEMVALYAMPPVYYPDDFSSFSLEGGRRAAIVWLIPVGDRELSRRIEVGWSDFEAELVACNPDILDLSREQIV
ncbi:Suppressor of fused protein (SUFU) [Streptomyces sp. 3213]|uniref:suppressor of fused domain protein n=1 Tax=Streptomyces sp. 3213.3 TaxID=1855348 RepID=UPI000897BC9B|nr:suppressor of fused domain protein [Streptomyces sp. 3213.3]SEE28134.1 Suppressor of fused protein (SUFU) [Streptomyces sp. 3213] [Streptomyces sp. 3213.3]